MEALLPQGKFISREVTKDLFFQNSFDFVSLNKIEELGVGTNIDLIALVKVIMMIYLLSSQIF